MTVAERAGRIAGFSYVGPHDHDDPTLGELYAIHVDPADLGMGLGRMLMIDALATLHGRGCRRGVLWVFAGNARARAFYARGGWAPDGSERDGEIGNASARQLRYSRDLP